MIKRIVLVLMPSYAASLLQGWAAQTLESRFYSIAAGPSSMRLTLHSYRSSAIASICAGRRQAGGNPLDWLATGNLIVVANHTPTESGLGTYPRLIRTSRLDQPPVT
jgi:hypothetical protein